MLQPWIWLFVVYNTGVMVSGYASWLPCYVDMDPSEIVMHHPMKWSTSSSDDIPLLQIQIMNEWQTGTLVPTTNHANAIPPQPYQITLSGTPQAHTWRVLVGLSIPKELEGEEVQYVIHVEPVTLSTDTTMDDDDISLPPKEAPHFVGTTNQCDGQRAHGTSSTITAGNDAGVPLEIPVSLLHHASHVILQGTWAKGMEAVTLTPPLLLHLPDFVTTTNGEEEL